MTGREDIRIYRGSGEGDGGVMVLPLDGIIRPLKKENLRHHFDAGGDARGVLIFVVKGSSQSLTSLYVAEKTSPAMI